MIDEYYLYTFKSTHGAIATETLFKPIGCMVMPVPRAISTSCGIAVRVSPDIMPASVDIFRKESDLEPGEYTVYHIKHDKDADDLKYEVFEI